MDANLVIDFIENTAKEYWEAYDFALPNIGKIPPIECVVKANRIAGFAYYSDKVEFNLAYFCSHHNTTELAEIIAHELAHIIQYRIYPRARQAHGPEFRYIMQSIGFAGHTYHSMSVSKAKAISKDVLYSIDI
jgi:predicted SprT family Zn-dependent metalloprotease